MSDSTYAKTDYCSVQKLFNNNNEISVGAEKYRLGYLIKKLFFSNRFRIIVRIFFLT